MSKFDSIESLERERVYSFRFYFINWITRGRLNKLLSKILIYLIKARDILKGSAIDPNLDVSNSCIISNIESAIKTIQKIYKV